MSQSTEPTNQPPSGRSVSKLGIVLIIITIISLAAAGYAVLNPRATTVTQQQFITNMQTSNVVQVVTVNSVVTVTVGTNTVAGAPANAQNCGYYGCAYSNSNPNCGASSCAYPTCDSNGCSFQLCGPNGCTFASPGYTPAQQQCGFNGCPYTTCLSTGQGNSVQCAGYLQVNNGCTELVIPVANYAIGAGETTATQYYTLHNLPSSYPPIGSWVTVNGQLNTEPNTASNGAACPGNYINVTSVTQS